MVWENQLAQTAVTLNCRGCRVRNSMEVEDRELFGKCGIVHKTEIGQGMEKSHQIGFF